MILELRAFGTGVRRDVHHLGEHLQLASGGAHACVLSGPYISKFKSAYCNPETEQCRASILLIIMCVHLARLTPLEVWAMGQGSSAGCASRLLDKYQNRYQYINMVAMC